MANALWRTTRSQHPGAYDGRCHLRRCRGTPQLWAWDGTNWHQLPSTGLPGDAGTPSIVDDPDAGEMVVLVDANNVTRTSTDSLGRCRGRDVDVERQLMGDDLRDDTG